jgi:hypothetical protein
MAPIPGQLAHKVVSKVPVSTEATNNVGEHKFVPLTAASRRTSEPIVVASKHQSPMEKAESGGAQAVKGESDEKSDRPVLQRGQTVYERPRTLSNDNTNNNKHRQHSQAYYSPGNAQRGNHMHVNSQYKANQQAQSLPVHAGHYIAQGSGASYVTPVGYAPPQASYGYPIPPTHYIAPTTYTTAGYSNAHPINQAYVLYPPPTSGGASLAPHGAVIHPAQTAYSYTAIGGMMPQPTQAAIYVTQDGLQVPVQVIAGSSSSVGSNMSGYGGSLQEPGVLMTDFGQALLRPDLDEGRRLQSHQYVAIQGHVVTQQPYWISSSPVESQLLYHPSHQYHGYSRERGTSVTESDLRYVQGVASSAPSASYIMNQGGGKQSVRRGSGNGLQSSKSGDLNSSNHEKSRSASSASVTDGSSLGASSTPIATHTSSAATDAVNTSDHSDDANISKNEDDKVDDCDPFFAVDDEGSE